MPVLKHAKKKLRQDKVRTAKNKKQKEQYKDLIKAAKKSSVAKDVSAAFKAIDKAAKNNLMHKNKAARLKSALSKLLDGKASATKVDKKDSPKSAAKKAPAKKSTTKKASKKTAKK